jgi:hypothetical protein
LTNRKEIKIIWEILRTQITAALPDGPVRGIPPEELRQSLVKSSIDFLQLKFSDQLKKEGLGRQAFAPALRGLRQESLDELKYVLSYIAKQYVKFQADMFQDKRSGLFIWAIIFVLFRAGKYDMIMELILYHMLEAALLKFVDT